MRDRSEPSFLAKLICFRLDGDDCGACNYVAVDSIRLVTNRAPYTEERRYEVVMSSKGLTDVEIDWSPKEVTVRDFDLSSVH